MYRTFKGTVAEYRKLHYWVAKQLGKPSECANCGTTAPRRYNWANISGEYLYDLSDWKRVCSPCHTRMDGVGIKPNVDRCLKRGHPWTSDNIYFMPNGYKTCRKCKRIMDRESLKKWRIKNRLVTNTSKEEQSNG